MADLKVNELACAVCDDLGLDKMTVTGMVLIMNAGQPPTLTVTSRPIGPMAKTSKILKQYDLVPRVEDDILYRSGF